MEIMNNRYYNEAMINFYEAVNSVLIPVYNLPALKSQRGSCAVFVTTLLSNINYSYCFFFISSLDMIFPSLS